MVEGGGWPESRAADPSAVEGGGWPEPTPVDDIGSYGASWREIHGLPLAAEGDGQHGALESEAGALCR